ncbi:MAG: enoyl-CoA hydratase/isomerase family protein [Bdellovibrionales bacterium]|nr:enoyl-CoA hydratase/isomerase family protein [Bdellovibrionales bacterium]
MGMIIQNIEGQIVTWGLDYPPCNEIGEEFVEDLSRCVDVLETRDDLRACVLYSRRDEGFCAGADLRRLYQEMQSMDKEQYVKKLRNFLQKIHQLFLRLDQCQKPIVTLVHGLCFGGGFELALCSDIIVAQDNARFAFPELRLGIIPCFGGIPRLSRDVGNAVVRDLLLTGRSINASKAKEIGLVSQVVKEASAMRMAMSLAKQMTKFDPYALKSCKAFMKQDLTSALDKELELAMKLFQRDQVLESLQKFNADQGPLPYLPTS